MTWHWDSTATERSKVDGLVCVYMYVSPDNRTTCLSSPTAEVLQDIVKGDVTYTATAILAHWILVDLAATQSALRQLLSAPSARCVHTTNPRVHIVQDLYHGIVHEWGV